ncbi:MAG: helix-turn-helix transcriptional regulator [Clostridia bacterium]|nr:helix-turn-helix transcriptional regulator [Clostridia bacterium]
MQAEFLLTTEKSNSLTITEVQNREYRFHFHSNIELCLVLEGEIEVWINDHRRVLKQGELSVAWSYDAHGYRTPKHSVSFSTIIPPRLYHEFLSRLKNHRASDPFLSDPALFDQILGWVRAAKRSDDELMRKGYIYIILSTLLKNMRFDEDPAQDPQLPSQVLLYLNGHFRDNLSLASVAHVLGYHQNYLSYTFKNTLQIGFHQYLTLLRLREAVLLIQAGEKSITECALESGFQSLRTFYRAFQSEFGCSPTAYLAESTQA